MSTPLADAEVEDLLYDVEIHAPGSTPLLRRLVDEVCALRAERLPERRRYRLEVNVVAECSTCDEECDSEEAVFFEFDLDRAGEILEPWGASLEASPQVALLATPDDSADVVAFDWQAVLRLEE